MWNVKVYKDEELEFIPEWEELEQTSQSRVWTGSWWTGGVSQGGWEKVCIPTGRNSMQDGKAGVCLGHVELSIWYEYKWW